MVAFTIASRKGGSGKSSLATSLACCAQDALLVDCDPQGTTGHWFQSRPDNLESPECVLAKPADVGKAIKATKRRYVFVDTPGDLSVRDAIAASDIVLLVIRPSIHDLRAVAGSVALLDGKPGVFVLNACPPPRMVLGEASLTREARQALKAFKLPICPVAISNRSSFVHAAVAGLGVTEWTDPRAAEEVVKVWEWICGR